MIIYWETLEKNAGDVKTIPAYIASDYFTSGFYPAAARKLLALGSSGELILPVSLAVDIIKEKTSTTGVTVDGLLIKDGKAPALSVRVGSFTIDMATASGTQTISGIGFTLKSIIFFANKAGTSQMSVGVDDGTTCSVLADQNAVAAGTYGLSIGFSIYAFQDGSNYYLGKITAIDSTSFTITWIKAGSQTGTLTIGYLALG